MTEHVVGERDGEDAESVPAPASRGDARRLDLVRATMTIIAERGFEGLRTREVAARAGVNIATLHYYFATKEALISGVADYLSHQFQTVHAPPLYAGAGTPLDWLRQEFADTRYYRTERMEMWVAVLELSQHAARDPVIARIMQRLERHWHDSIAHVLTAGVEAGIFRPDLEIDAATYILLAFFRGAHTAVRDEATFDRACAEIERWLTAAAPDTARASVFSG